MNHCLTRRRAPFQLAACTDAAAGCSGGSEGKGTSGLSVGRAISIDKKPAGANGGQVTRSGQPSCPRDHIMSQIGEQLDELRRLVEQFDKLRDYRAWEVAQKALLNAQAIAVAAGWRR